MLHRVFTYIPATTIIIVFFFVCGGLYLVGYWSTFDIDITSLVNLTDIPKSFILPSAITHFLFISSFFVGMLVSKFFRSKEQEGVTDKARYNFFKTIDILLILFTPISLCLAYFFSNNPLYWVVSALVLSLLILAKCMIADISFKVLPNLVLRLYVLHVLISTPILCFSIGKAISTNIYNNKNIKYIAINRNIIDKEIFANMDSVSLKFLGFLDDKLIISTLDNKKIIIINQPSFEGVILESKGDRSYWFPF